jgi:hypothetical protein
MNPNIRLASPAPSSAPASEELRALAAWYREYAEQAGSTMIWDYRLSTAEDLERQAAGLEARNGQVFQ